MKRNGPRVLESGGAFHLHVVAEVLDLAHQAPQKRAPFEAVEVIGTEIAVRDAVTQDEVGGGEQGGGDRDDRLLRAAAGLEAEKRRAGIARLARVADQAACTSCVLSQGAPSRSRVERRLPAVSMRCGSGRSPDGRLN
jgi:hypothetical protein